MPKTEEGKLIYANAERYDRASKGEPPIKPPWVKKDSLEKQRNDFFIRELEILLANSELVVKECDEAMITFKNREDYLKSEIKVARYIHAKMIVRYKRLLNWESAFEKPIR